MEEASLLPRPTMTNDPLRRLRATQLSTRAALSSLLRLTRPHSLGPLRRPRASGARLCVWARRHAGAGIPTPLCVRDTLPRQA